MLAQIKRIFFWLAVISSIVFFMLLGNLSKCINWAPSSRRNKHSHSNRVSDGNITSWEVNENSTPPHPGFNNTAHKAKDAVSTETNPGSKRENDQMKAVAHEGEAKTPIPVLYKKSFKKFPQWDFEDVYNQDAPLRPNTCAQSLLNTEDESFKKVFLPNIRLYLHKDSINMNEWNRLSHFNNPFGFMEYNYNDVMSSLKLIPKPKEPLLLPKPGSGGCVRCAVVGTGGILNGSKMGKEIDSHDYVFRMNAAVIKGYEDDVGNKTSVYVHTAHSIVGSPYFFSEYGYKSVPVDEGIKFVMIPEGMRDFEWLKGLVKGEMVINGEVENLRPRTYYAGQYNESRFYVLHQDFLRYVRNRFLKSADLNEEFWDIVRPSTGAFTLFLALHTCDIVSAYGLMTEDYNKYPNYYFERDVKTEVIFYVNHDLTLEMKMWKKLHDSKIIRLYQRTNPETPKQH